MKASIAERNGQALAARAGQAMEPWVVEVTPTLIIAGALATRDAQDVHHDVALARQRGFKDIFLNNFTTMALVSRYVTDWAGPHAVIESFSFRLGRPQYPDDELRFSGNVAQAEHDASASRLALDIAGDNREGNHVRCTVKVVIRRRPAN